MTSSQPWKQYHNKNLPRADHSTFGDFPQEYMKKADKGVTEVEPIDK